MPKSLSEDRKEPAGPAVGRECTNIGIIVSTRRFGLVIWDTIRILLYLDWEAEGSMRRELYQR